MSEECAGWARDLERLTPTIVLVIERPDGAPASGATLTIDGASVTAGPRPIALDPGSHALQVVVAGFDPIVLPVVVREGEQATPVVARLLARSPEAPPPARSRAPELALAGVSLGAFTLGAVGWPRRSSTTTTSPRAACTTAAATPSRGSAPAVAADVSFGVMVALAISAVLHFRPVRDIKASRLPAPSGGTLAFEQVLR